MISKQYYVYNITNINDTVLYIGVTNNLIRRIYEHKNKLLEGFSKKYNIWKLVYYEIGDDVRSAIEREKKLKGWTRQKKIDLIKLKNPEFKELTFR